MTRPATYARPGLLPDARPRATASRRQLALNAARLTARDTLILNAVWEHRALTTDQITRLYFPSVRRARQRLLELFTLGVLERFRPWAPEGSLPFHWVLGPAGAHHLAAHQGVEVRELRYKAEHALAIAFSTRLAHQIGVNEFFTQLHAAARARDDGSRLAQWWPERRCAALWGDLVKPDAYGQWIDGGENKPRKTDFFLEHDTGTEPLARLAGKLPGYEALAESTGITTPVLFWLPNSAREANFRKLIGRSPVPIATAVHGHDTAGDRPDGPVWLPHPSQGVRVCLGALQDAWPGISTSNGRGAS